MKEVKLDIIKTLKKRFSDKSPLIQVILGPLQVGKTTAIRQFIDTYEASLPI